MAEGVLIAGDGPVAGLLALALSEHGVPFLMCGDGRAPPDRPIALSHGSRLLLEHFGAFDSAAATPIETIHVSQRGGFGRTVIRAVDEGLPALGYVISYADLCAALKRRLVVPVIDARLAHFSPTSQGDAVQVDLMDARTGEERTLTSRLLVLAEGGRPASILRGGTSSTVRPGERLRDYGQSAVVSHVNAEIPHRNGAWERFTPGGPLALLPSGDDLALVWSTTHASAHALCALRDAAFLARLSETFGGRLGKFVRAGPRAVFPVSLRYEPGSPMQRVVSIGNAAQTLHPVAGQGLNLGLRDAWELARGLRDAAADPGSAPFLRAYLRDRALDRAAGIRVTDALVRTFSNDNPALALARGVGLAALDLAAPARRFLARRMMFGARAW